MKNILGLLLLMAIAFPGFTQKVIHDPLVEKREVSAFKAIEVSHGIDLYLSAGAETVAVSAATVEFRNMIQTKVENGVLKISLDPDKRLKNLRWGNQQLRAYVSFRELERIDASGGSDVSVEGIVKGTRLEVEASGGSDFRGAVEVTDLNLHASGGSDISIRGRANNLKAEVSGGSDLSGYDLTTEKADIQASGGSDVFITVNKEINASASGGSDIFFKGDAPFKFSTGGSIKKVTR